MATIPVSPIPPSFTLETGTNSVLVPKGASGTCFLRVVVFGAFNSAVALSASIPAGAGITAAFSSPSIAAPGSGTSTLTLTATSSWESSTIQINITGTGGGITETVSIWVTLSSFMLTASPTPVAVLQGASVPFTITSAIASGFNGAVALSATNLPSGITAAFGPLSIAAPGAGTSTLTLSVGGALAGSYGILVLGTAVGGLIASVFVYLQVSAVAKVVSLRARAAQAAILCFSVDGILEEMDAQLGATVTSFDFPTFYGNLSAVASAPSDRSLLQYNSANIYAGVARSRLAALRAEPIKAALDSAVLSRQNAFYNKYIAINGITDIMQPYSNTAVSPAVTTSTASTGNVTGNLQNLSSLNLSLWQTLLEAYQADNRISVVRTTSNAIQPSIPGSTAPNSGVVTTQVSTNVTTTPGSNSTVSDEYNIVSGQSTLVTEIKTVTTPTPTITTSAPSANQSVTTTTGQTTLNTDYAYRVPYIEGQAQMSRAVISLINQQYAQYLFGVQVPYVSTILNNELKAIDLGVKRLQVAYLDTMLMSPIRGQVTGLFKNVGERVKAGEPVLRVEGSPPGGASFLLVGTLRYNEPIVGGGQNGGSMVTVITTMWGNSATASLPANAVITFSGGYVLTARGHGDQEDLWDVVVAFYNVENLPPLNYCFDCDDTIVIISTPSANVSVNATG